MHPHFTPAILARFWSKVNKHGPIPPHCPELGECWVWTGGMFNTGYGVFHVETKGRGAHRYAYEATYGSIPKGLFILHRCDNPACVRPDHLRAGTQKENTYDCIAKHRKPLGHATGRTPLQSAQIDAIRRDTCHTKTELSAMFGVSRQTISRILRGVTWAHHVTPP